jgi:hypothetical protein
MAAVATTELEIAQTSTSGLVAKIARLQDKTAIAGSPTKREPRLINCALPAEFAARNCSEDDALANDSACFATAESSRFFSRSLVRDIQEGKNIKNQTAASAASISPPDIEVKFITLKI